MPLAMRVLTPEAPSSPPIPRWVWWVLGTAVAGRFVDQLLGPKYGYLWGAPAAVVGGFFRWRFQERGFYRLSTRSSLARLPLLVAQGLVWIPAWVVGIILLLL